MSSLVVKTFFDETTFTATHIASDPEHKICAIIDSVLGYDPASGRTDTALADQLLTYISKNALKVAWILETHVHADHLSAAPYLKSHTGGKIAIGAHIPDIQSVFSKVFNTNPEFIKDGSQFDHLFKEGDTFQIGQFEGRIIDTPGHTPACIAYVIDDAIFVGDTLFMPDYGSARCDFPGGDAAALYQSVQKIYELPDDTRMYLCHDYKAPGRDQFTWITTIGEQKRSNIHLNTHVSQSEFVKMRTERDKTLDMPKLILPSIQVNMRAGKLPPAENNGVQYLKIPLNSL